MPPSPPPHRIRRDVSPAGPRRRPSPLRATVLRRPAQPPCVWPPWLVELLGKLPDARLARSLGRNCSTVAIERRRRGIPPFRPQRRPHEWTAASIAQLGTASDGDVAAALGLTRPQVQYRRRMLGIPPFVPPPHDPVNASPWTPADLALLGTMSDQQAATRLGRTVGPVSTRRRQRKIRPFHPRPPDVVWTAEMLEQLGRVRDAELAERYGISTKTVKKKRRLLGIPGLIERRHVVPGAGVRALLRQPTVEVRRRTGLARSTIRRLRDELGVEPPRPGRPWQPAEIALLGTAPDAEVAAMLGRSPEAVAGKRRELRVAPLRRQRQAS